MDEIRVKEEVLTDDCENDCNNDQNALIYGVTVKQEPEDFPSVDPVPFDEITIKAEKIEPPGTSDDNATDIETGQTVKEQSNDDSMKDSCENIKKSSCCNSPNTAAVSSRSNNAEKSVTMSLSDPENNKDDDGEDAFQYSPVKTLPLSSAKRPREPSSSDEDKPPTEETSPRRARSIRKPSRYRSQEFATYEELIAIRKTLKITKALDRSLKNSNKNPEDVDGGPKTLHEISSSLDENLLGLDENLVSLDKNPNIVEKNPKSLGKNSKTLDKKSKNLVKKTKSFDKETENLNKNSKRANKKTKSREKHSRTLDKNVKSLDKHQKMSSKTIKSSHKNSKSSDTNSKNLLKKSKDSTKKTKSREKNSKDWDEGSEISNEDCGSLDLYEEESDEDDGSVVNRLVDKFVDELVEEDDGLNESVTLESEESSEEETEGLLMKPRISDFSLFCNDCKVAWEGECPTHGPLVVVKDKRVISQNVHSMMTAPPQVYIGTFGGYRVADSPKNGRGVFAKKKLPSRIRFGPLQGKIVPPDTPRSWLIRKNGKPFRGIDISSPDTSNWMRYVKVSRSESEVNCDAYQYQGLIFFKTIREISPQEELVVGAYDYNGFLLKQDEEFEKPPTEPTWENELQEFVALKDSISEEDAEDLKISSLLCPLCFESFPTESELDEHVRIHTKEKPFPCTKCNKRFADQSMLFVHENNHTLRKKNDSPVSCPQCNKVFSSNANLKKHSYLHSGEKPFECLVCKARFSRNSHLKSHSVTHSDERPFECMVCSKTFKIKRGLTRHMAVHSC